MKIIVANKHEKELVRKFIEQCVDEDILCSLIQNQEKENKEIFEEETLNRIEGQFLEVAFLEARIEVGKTMEMYVDYESALDTCQVCKNEMCINQDFDYVHYEEFVNHSYGNSTCYECSLKEN